MGADLQRLRAILQGLKSDNGNNECTYGDRPMMVPQYSIFEDLQVDIPRDTLAYTQQAAAPIEFEGRTYAHFPYGSYLCPFRDLPLLLPGH